MNGRLPCEFCDGPRTSETPLQIKVDGKKRPACAECKEVANYYRAWPAYLPKPEIDRDVILNGRKAL